MRHLTKALGLMLVLSAWARASDLPIDLPPKEVFSLLQDELSGQLAKDHVIQITRFHRVQGSQGYSDAAAYVLQALRSLGLDQNRAWIESFPCDGKKMYQTWQSPPGWHIESGELRLVQPSEELLVRYPEIGMSVMSYSNSGQARSELLDVGTGTKDSDYAGREVAGKFVLASGDAGTVHRLAVLKYGAAAIVSYLDDLRALQHPDMIGSGGIWPRTSEIPRVTFGFNIRNRQGRYLKKLLSEGKRVVLEGKVVGRGLEAGQLEVVVASIPGSERPEEQLLFTAHLDHPKESANDNASGSAALLDIVRSLESLIRRGKLAPPTRTIRFLWLPQYYGTMAYVDSHPELKGPAVGGKALAGLNLDMVGEDLGLLDSRMNIVWTPQTISSVLPDLTSLVASRVDQRGADASGREASDFNYRVTPFKGEGDHAVFNDGMLAVPSMMISHWPDYTQHTTEDSADKVDPVELKRSELIAASTLWTLASLSEEQSLALTNLVASNAQARLIQDTGKAVAWILDSPVETLEIMYQDARRVIEFALERESRNLQSILDFAPFEMTRRLVDTWAQSLEGQAELQRRTLHAIFYQRAGRLPIATILSEPERRASRLVPARLTRGPLAPGIPERSLSDADRAWYSTDEARSIDPYLLVNLIDGHRSVLEIRNTLSAATRPVALRAVERYIRDLASARVVQLNQID